MPQNNSTQPPPVNRQRIARERIIAEARGPGAPSALGGAGQSGESGAAPGSVTFVDETGSGHDPFRLGFSIFQDNGDYLANPTGPIISGVSYRMVLR